MVRSVLKCIVANNRLKFRFPFDLSCHFKQKTIFGLKINRLTDKRVRVERIFTVLLTKFHTATDILTCQI